MPVSPRRHATTPSVRTAAPVEPLESRQLLSAGFHSGGDNMAPRSARADFGRGAIDAPVADFHAHDGRGTTGFSRDSFDRASPEAGHFDSFQRPTQAHWPASAPDDSPDEPVAHVPAGSTPRPEPQGLLPVAVVLAYGEGDAHTLVPAFERAGGPVFVLPPPVGPSLQVAVVRVTTVTPAPLSQPAAIGQQAQRADAPSAGPVTAPARAAPADVRSAARPEISDSGAAPAVAPVASAATSAVARGALAAVASNAPVIAGTVSTAARVWAVASAGASSRPAASKARIRAHPPTAGPCP